ncbi:MAG TPA: hypothetical protein VFQ61_21820 [Polyangiaceae bacterium]|nr:hypothetical protein [Polyangiaceae bacterium]
MMIEADTLVIGAGPVGALAAWLRAEREQVVVAARTAFGGDAAPILEVIPGSTVALLEETLALTSGISPIEERLVAWSSAEPTELAGAPYVVDRSVLDPAILARVVSHPRVSVVPELQRDLRVGPYRANGIRAARVIDATGRSAVTATHRVSFGEPWAAWSFWSARPRSVRPGLRVAALTTGYAIRISSSRHTVFSFMGPAREPLSASEWMRSVKHEAPFVLEGCSFGQWERGGTRCPSLAIFDGNELRIGDASFARDALSSQGLAAGLSEALYAAAVESVEDAELLRRRQRAQLADHLTSLWQAASSVRFADAPVWTGYRACLSALQRTLTPAASHAPLTALERGRITSVDAEPAA